MYSIKQFILRNYYEAREYGNPVTDFQIGCPFCKSAGNKLHMYVSINKNVVHCFKCGYGANWVTFVMDVMHCNYVQAIAELYVVPKIREGISDFLARELQVRSITASTKQDTHLPDDFQLLQSAHSMFTERAKKYLHKRGFEQEDWEYYNIGVCAVTHPARVVIPIEDGYYQARAMSSSITPKYVNPKTEARHYIFNSSALELYDEIVICEGAFNAMAVGKNAIAIIGKELPVEKLVRLASAPVKHYIVALDYGANKHAVAIADSLHRNGKSVAMWKFESELDPADGGSYEELSYDFGSKMNMLLTR